MNNRDPTGQLTVHRGLPNQCGGPEGTHVFVDPSTTNLYYWVRLDANGRATNASTFAFLSTNPSDYVGLTGGNRRHANTYAEEARAFNTFILEALANDEDPVDARKRWLRGSDLLGLAEAVVYGAYGNGESAGAMQWYLAIPSILGLARDLGLGAGRAISDLPKGARGPASGRDFDPEQAGGPIRSLSTDGVRITARGIDAVEAHLARFGHDSANAVMLNRLRRIAAGELKQSQADLNFYTHELREFVRYRRLGWPAGDPGYDVWNNAHTATLEDYGINERANPLYHPDACLER